MTVGRRHAGPGHDPVPTGHVKNHPVRKRTAAKRSFVAAAASLEPHLHEAILDLFARQEKATLSRLQGNRGRTIRRQVRAAQPPDQPPPQGPPPAGQPAQPPDAAQIFDIAFWTDQTARTAGPIIDQAGHQGATRAAGQLGQPEPVKSSLPAVDDILKQRTNRLAGQVTQTTFDQIQQALADGVSHGESIARIADRVRHVFQVARSRAELIARTEVVGAMNEAAHGYASNLPPGTVGRKEWLCVAAGTRVASAKPVEVVERRRTAGYMTRLRTKAGRVLAVTPNHPILTEWGWVPAHELDSGDKLVCQVAADPMGMDSASPFGLGQRYDPDVDDAPPVIDEIFRTASLTCTGGRMVAVVPDLYSDPTDCEVEVVPVNSDLAAHLIAPLKKQSSDFVFELTDVQLLAFVSQRLLDQELIRTCPKPESLLGGHALGSSALLEVGVARSDQKSSVAIAPQVEAPCTELAAQQVVATPNPMGNGRDRFPFPVALDEIVQIDTIWLSGRHQVYDLVTEQGWFVANDILVHNSVHDTRTRMTHRIADGQKVPMWSPFVVGGSLMMHPGDPEAPPDEVCNCRCSLLYLPGPDPDSGGINPIGGSL